MHKEIKEVSSILAAIQFAAEKHRKQRRKDEDGDPYINHSITVTELLARIGGVTDIITLTAAVLHDTIEDTDTYPEEIKEMFGEEVLSIVMEVTDDKKLPKKERKHLQIEQTPHLSFPAKQVKLADKIANISTISTSPPKGWPRERLVEYLDWAENVVTGLRGCNTRMENLFLEILTRERAQLADRIE